MKIVYIVHAVDTEGPLYESLSAKFERIKDLFGIDVKKKNLKNFKKIKKKKLFYKNKKIEIGEIFNEHLNNYNENWDQLDSMIKEMMTDNFRKNFKDSFNGTWKFTWHCLDHVGYRNNPRKRTLGDHKIFDYYQKKVKKFKKFGDTIQWHYHPVSTFGDAHFCATSYFRKQGIYEILCKKILDRNFFPSCYRAGFQAERPDSNWFLEQWIPFDITNMAIKDKSHWDKFRDFRKGRSGNWKNAPYDWEIYNPDIRDYQIKGNCKRYIGRALNILNRIAPINQKEVNRAFEKANNTNSPVLMGLSSHDWRDMRNEVKFSYDLIKKASNKFKNVKFQFLSVQDGFQKTIFKKNNLRRKLIIKIKKNFKNKNDHPNFTVKIVNGDIFGPQPFLAIKTRNNQYIYDNFDFINKNEWGYSFHDNTLHLNKVKEIGIATNDKYGYTYIKKISI
jgi:hypothetical protein